MRKKNLLLVFSLSISLLYLSCVILSSSVEQPGQKETKKAYSKMRKLLSSEAFQKDIYRQVRRESIKGTMADYDSEPRISNDPGRIASPDSETRVDIEQLVKHCEELGVNCYHFLIWHQPADWMDCQLFVKAAEKSKILTERKFTVWVYLVPPSESQKMKSEPFGTDYVAWMDHVAKFSRVHPSVTAVCIDDFYGSEENRSLFTRDYLQKMLEAAHRYNRNLALVTVFYWEDVDPSRELEVMEEACVIGDAIDGILYAYMAESLRQELSHKNTSALASEIKRIREVYPAVPVIVDIYVAKHTGSPDLPGPAWVNDMLDIAKKNADGVALYCMPKKNKDGSFPDFWDKSMADPPGIFETVRAKYYSWLRPGRFSLTE